MNGQPRRINTVEFPKGKKKKVQTAQDLATAQTAAPDIGTQLTEAYRQLLQPGTAPQAPIGIADVIGRTTAGAEEGGLLGGVTSGLGGLAQYLGTAEGQRILAGLSGDPYMGEALAEQADITEARQRKEKSIFKATEMERQKRGLAGLEKSREFESKEAARIAKARAAARKAKLSNIKNEQLLRKEYKSDPVVKDSKEITSAVSRMNTVWDDYIKNPSGKSLLALDQALVITFNKMLDPGSVVRESEFARTTEGQALIAKLEGFTKKLVTGGVGLTDDDRKEIVRTAQLLQAGQLNALKKVDDDYINIAKKSGFDPEIIIGSRVKTDEKDPAGLGF